MIEHKVKANTEEELKQILNPIVKEWFFKKFEKFSLPQLFGVMEIHSRANILVSAPTGATKTLTAFLSILNELIDSSQKEILQDKIYCVYVSPLKALGNDIQHNLVEPLKEMEEAAGKKLGIRVGVRTGDTTTAEKQKMLRKPPHILITTPESLAIMLTSPKFRDHLKAVEWCVVDEIHALAENKRGVHLSLSLERLDYLSPHMTRIGLSATIAPLEEIALFLVGFKDDKPRDCKIADVQFLKEMDLKVMSPVEDLISTPHSVMHQKMYELIDNLVQSHRTTLIFTNTRSATERVIDHLKDRWPQKYTSNIGAHHGSLSKTLRHDIETRLRNGELKVIVSSTSLELGIDIGYIDLVICLGSPKSVARFLQRAGRSGHKLHDKVKARIIVLDRDDLVECSVLLKCAIEKKIDKIHLPTNCLDVLAQQIDGFALEQKWNVDELFKIIKQSYPFKDLQRKDYIDILQYLAGKFTSLEDRHIYAKIWYDPESNMIGKKGRLGRVIYMTNIGTIPDEMYITVKIGEQAIGQIDEAFLERLKKGDVFVLGGEKYEFLYAKGMVAYVRTSVYRPPTIPSWFSEMLPLSFDLALEIGRFRRLIKEKFSARQNEEEVMGFINQYLYVDSKAAKALYNYFKEQAEYLEIPTDKSIIMETYNDGKQTYYLLHSLFGRRVNDALSRAVGFAVSRVSHRDVSVGINDNGFYLMTNQKVNVMKAFELLKSEKLDLVLRNAIETSEVLKRRFRHCATRALMILRQYKGRTQRVGRQQVSSTILISAVRRINPRFPILEEARREVLEDLMDEKSASIVLKQIEDGKIKIQQYATTVPSPFAFNLIVQGYTDLLKIEDRMEFLKRMHEMVLAKISLKQGKKQPENKIKSYEELWIEQEEKLEAEKEDKIDSLKMQAWNIEGLSITEKEQLAEMIEGREVKDGFIEFLRKKKSEIEKWPKELSELVKQRINH
ncbi:MAG: ATP-dependent helicase [Candidatus Woesearchaeota archaeon]